MNKQTRFKTYVAGLNSPETGTVRWLIDFREKKLYSEQKCGGLSLALPSRHRKRTFQELRATVDEALEAAEDGPFADYAMDHTVHEDMKTDIDRYQQIHSS